MNLMLIFLIGFIGDCCWNNDVELFALVNAALLVNSLCLFIT
jgi:hypothetical protein